MTPGASGRSIAPARSSGDAGSVAVEYALTLPILLALIYGICEISHYAFIKMAISDVAHDAARYAIVHSAGSSSPKTSSDISTYVTNELTQLLLTATPTVTVTYTPSNAEGGTVEVQISYPFTPFMPGFNRVPGSAQTFTDVVGPIATVAQMVISP